MASEAAKIAGRSNMCMHTRIIGATEHNFEIRSDLCGYLEVTVASKANKLALRGNVHVDIRVIYASNFKFEA